MKSFFNNISLTIILFFIIAIILLLALNSGQNTVQMNSLEKYGKTISDLLAKASISSFVSQRYDDLNIYFDSLMKNDPDIVEVFCLDYDGKYVAYKNRDNKNNDNLGKNIPQKIILKYQNENEPFSFPSDDGKYLDFVAPIKIASSVCGFVNIRYNLGGINKNNVTNKMLM